MRAVRAILRAACLGAAWLALAGPVAWANDPHAGDDRTATATRAPSTIRPAATTRPTATTRPAPTNRPAARAPAAAPAPAGVTLAAQRQLAARLRAIKGGPLAAALDHNRSQWTGLSPDQRSRFRQEALAFLSQSPDQQDRLLRQYQRLVALSAERQENYRRIAQWLTAVVDSMTPAERKALLDMAPQQRAKALLERKAELVAQGKLPADPAPSTQPAGAAD